MFPRGQFENPYSNLNSQVPMLRNLTMWICPLCFCLLGFHSGGYLLRVSDTSFPKCVGLYGSYLNHFDKKGCMTFTCRALCQLTRL